VQNLIQLARTRRPHLKLTTARYYLPSGKSLHRDEDSVEWGVEPDISVPLVSKEFTKVLQGFSQEGHHRITCREPGTEGALR